MSEGRAIGLMLVLIAIYSGWYALGYVSQALGMNPQLDAAEMIRLAEQIASGTLPKEPFYRAAGYALSLALLLKLGANVLALPLLAALLNVLLHLLNVLLVGALARMLEAPTLQRVAAMALYGLYPIAVYFVAEPSDVTLAISLMLLGVFACLKTEQRLRAEKGVLLWVLVAGLAFGLATFTRPQMLPVGLAAFGWLAFRLRHEVPALFTLGSAMLAPLFLMGALNQSISGDFRMLPWQGTYALYKANSAEADPRYMSQVRSLGELKAGDNPTRAESFARFEELTGERARSIAELNQFFKARMIRDIFDQPLDWLNLQRKRAFYALNNFEQYNNKTYSWQAARFPLLRFNPLCFGLVLVLGVAGFAFAWRDPRHRLLGLLTVMVFASLLISWPSDRFRLPMVPLLLVLATAVRFERQQWKPWLWAIPALGLTLYPIPRAEREITYGNDALLWGNAHSGRGEFTQARIYYLAARDQYGERARAGDALCRLDMNTWLIEHAQAKSDWPSAEDERNCSDASARAGSLEASFILGLIQHSRGDSSSALAALKLVREGENDRLRGRAIVAQTMIERGDLSELAANYPEIRLSPDPALWIALADPRAQNVSAPERAAAARLWSAFTLAR